MSSSLGIVLSLDVFLHSSLFKNLFFVISHKVMRLN